MRKRGLIVGVFGGTISIGGIAQAAGINDTLFLQHFDTPYGMTQRGPSNGAGTADYAAGDPTEQIYPTDPDSPGFGPGGDIVSSPAKFGNSLNRGTGGRVEYQTASNWNPNVGTIEMWINSSTLTSNGFVGLWGTDTGTGNSDVRMYIYPVGGVETLGAYMSGGGGTFWEIEQPIPLTMLTNNTWHSVAWEYNTATAQTATFWDGQLLRNTPDTGVVNPRTTINNTLFHIGENQGGSATFPGYIDEFRISDVMRYNLNSNYTPQTAPFSVASSLTWATGSASWDTTSPSNWNNGSGLATYTDPANVTFEDTLSGASPITVSLNTAVSPGSVTVNNSAKTYIISGSGGIHGAGALTKQGASTLTLNTVNSYSGGTNVIAGKLVIGASGALPSNQAVTVAGPGILQLGASTGVEAISSLSITGNGTLDINNNHLFINYGTGSDPIAAIKSYIASGYAGGAWTGTGIASTAAQTNSASYGIGYADSADPGNPAGLASGQIEVKYTLLGDANLDGAVNGSDFAILASNFNKAVSGWDAGDFNYDGAANGSDFASLASNFNKGASQAALDSFATANGLLADVPEPATFGCSALGIMGFLTKRRR